MSTVPSIGAERRIAVEDLRQGMFLVRLEGSWWSHSIWRLPKGTLDADAVRQVQRSGATWCWVRGAGEPTTQAVAAPDMPATGPTPLPEPGHTPHTELAAARRVAQQARTVVAGVFDQARLGGAIDSQAARAVVEDVVASATRDPSTLLSLVRVKTRDDYTYQHSVAVCVLMVSLARQLGLPDDQVRDAGLAGLVHDVGKALIPQHILNKPGPLSDAEMAVMRTHSMLGQRALLESGVEHRPSLDVALHHHERVDGKGYPKQLRGDDLSPVVRMAAVCDVYDAITSLRVYKEPWSPAEALRRMASWSGQFDRAMLAALIHVVGAYPVGTVVRLASGRLAVVVAMEPSAPQRPTVQLLERQADGSHQLTQTLKLSRGDVAGADAIQSMVDAVEATRLGFGQSWLPWDGQPRAE